MRPPLPSHATIPEGTPRAAVEAALELLASPSRPPVVVVEASLAARMPPEPLAPSGREGSPFRILPELPDRPTGLGADPVEVLAARLAEEEDPPAVLGPEARLVAGEADAKVVVIGALGAASTAVQAELPPVRLRVDAGRDSFGGLAGLLARLTPEALEGVELIVLLGLRPSDEALAPLMALGGPGRYLAWEPDPALAAGWATLGVPTTPSLPAALRCARLVAAGVAWPAPAQLIATSPSLATLVSRAFAEGVEAPLSLPTPTPDLAAALAEHLPTTLAPANPLLLQPAKAASPALPPAHHRHASAAASAASTALGPRGLVLLASPDDDPLPHPAEAVGAEVWRVTPRSLGDALEAARLAARLGAQRAAGDASGGDEAAPSAAATLPDGLRARLMAALLMRLETLRGPDAVALLAALSGLPRASATLITTAGHGLALLRRAAETDPGVSGFLTLAPEPARRSGGPAAPDAPTIAVPSAEALEAAFDAVCDPLPPTSRLAPRVLLTASGVSGPALRLTLTRAPLASHVTWGPADGARPPLGRARVANLPPWTASGPLPADLAPLVGRLAAALSDLDAVRALRLDLAPVRGGGLALLDGTLSLDAS